MLRILLVALIAAAPLAAQATQELLNLVPPDAKIVAGMRIDEARETPFGQYVLTEMEKHSEDIEKLLADTDFDIRQDLDEIVMGSTGFTKESEGIMAARGAFNAQRILTFAGSKGATVSSYRDIPILSGPHEKETGVAFLGMNLLVMGHKEHVWSAIDRSLAAETSASEVLQRAREVSSGKHSWCLIAAPLVEILGKDDIVPAGAPVRGDLIRSIQEMSGGVTFGETVILSATAVTDEPEAATALGNVVQFFTSLARLNAKDPDMADLLGRLLRDLDIDPDPSVPSITVTLAVAQADIEKFLEHTHKHHRGHDKEDNRRRASPSDERTGRVSRSGSGR